MNSSRNNRMVRSLSADAAHSIKSNYHSRSLLQIRNTERERETGGGFNRTVRGILTVQTEVILMELRAEEEEEKEKEEVHIQVTREKVEGVCSIAGKQREGRRVSLYAHVDTD
ncbi:Hypothetical predicted protein [Xyrichtys novacula]|uniref:Uncharacterized protein n=1 Tax=Xyrichtys novacula TaxID=13765 RepID=A0AAV1FX92_XYRNO|nr:Hypothetical predicted protein [Xyrichtys novacula]